VALTLTLALLARGSTGDAPAVSAEEATRFVDGGAAGGTVYRYVTRALTLTLTLNPYGLTS